MHISFAVALAHGLAGLIATQPLLREHPAPLFALPLCLVAAAELCTRSRTASIGLGIAGLAAMVNMLRILFSRSWHGFEPVFVILAAILGSYALLMLSARRRTTRARLSIPLFTWTICWGFPDMANM